MGCSTPSLIHEHMRTARVCPVCGDERGRRHGAVLAPFIRTWVRPGIDRRDLMFRICACCGLGFFEQRFEPQEMERLYGRYRSSAYLECRRAVEPWYSAALNAANLSPAVIAARRSQLDRFLRQTLPAPAGVDRLIVDLGGDAGQFIPQDLAAGSYVLESSDQDPWPGLTRIVSLAASLATSWAAAAAGLLRCSEPGASQSAGGRGAAIVPQVA